MPVPEAKRYVYVCTTDEPDRCGQKGGIAVLAEFRRLLKERGLGKDFKCTHCGCTSQHAEGPIVLVVPEGIFYRGVQAADVPDIIEQHLIGVQAVARLFLRRAGDITAPEAA